MNASSEGICLLCIFSFVGGGEIIGWRSRDEPQCNDLFRVFVFYVYSLLLVLEFFFFKVPSHHLDLDVHIQIHKICLVLSQTM